MQNFPDNAVVLSSEPLKGYCPQDIRLWLYQNSSEADFATALAMVHNQSGWLSHDLDELEEPEHSKALAIFNEWWELQKELYDKIIVILKSENASGKANHRIADKGLHYVILPFMERYGYRDGAGWWVKKTAFCGL